MISSIPTKYLWILLGSLFVQSSLCARVDTDFESPAETSKSSRQPRQYAYRGNTRFQLPSYLSPDHYAREIYSHDRRGAPDGSFSYEYQTDNGIKRKEESFGYGANKVVRGFYSYVGPDGQLYTTRYIADRFGYRAYGDHLPTQPDELFDQTRFPPQPPPRPIQRPFIQPEQNRPLNYPQRPHPLPVQPEYHQHYEPSTDRYDRYDNNPSQQYNLPSTPFQSRPIYVQEPSTSNYVSITPRPVTGPTLLPAAAYLSSSNHYANQPYSWTTAKPQYGAPSSIRPYI